MKSFGKTVDRPRRGPPKPPRVPRRGKVEDQVKLVQLVLKWFLLWLFRKLIKILQMTLQFRSAVAPRALSWLLILSMIRTANACGEVSTVYLTVTAAPSTTDLAVESTSIQSAAGVDLQAFTANLDLQPTNPVAPPDTSSGVTATTTIFLTYTEAVELAQVTATSSTAGVGEPYYFTEHDGTTAWLSAKAPSATQGFFTGTTTVLVAPVPTEGSKHTTSTETALLTLTTTKHLTKTVVEAQKTDPTSIRSFKGLGASGWNATSTTFQTVKVWPTGSGVIVSGNQLYQTGVPSSVVQLLPSGYTKVASAPSATVPWKNVKRQVGSIVVATINGVVVSWTNAYDGGALATPVAGSPSSVEGPASSGMLDMQSLKALKYTNLSRSCSPYKHWLCVRILFSGSLSCNHILSALESL